MPDIDIDFADRSIILNKIQHRVAKLDTGKKHNTGVYATEIPHNPIDNLSTVEHKTTEDRGYFKLDFLNVSIYKDVESEICGEGVGQFGTLFTSISSNFLSSTITMISAGLR